ncbi:MAG TPA: asparagine synthase C-terminal domain-containing protein, partial [Gemmatimonadaceae bacterium]|nr:asparagine synthase C-terminal domain-containing protein [Gemmatimonadaceae bacterium]
AAAHRSRPDLHAVTVGFDVAAYDERPLARLTARQVGITLDEELGATQPFSPDAIDEALRHHGQPFQDTSAFPTRAVSRAARRHFKVVLSGDGGDELFSGYLANLRTAKLRQLGGGSLGGKISGGLAALVSEFGKGESLKRALTLNSAKGDGLLPHVMEGVFTDAAVLSLFEGTPWEREARHRIGAMRDRSRVLWKEAREPNLAMSLFQLEQSLPQDILTKVDRMSMAESLEVRSAFLDSKLATYALSLPARFKVTGAMGKLVLREALRERLPQEVLAAPKRGFNLPVRDWLGRSFWNELLREVADYAADSAAEMNTKAIATIVRADELRCRETNSYRALHRAFLLYTFFRWRRSYAVGIAPSSPMLSAAQP